MKQVTLSFRNGVNPPNCLITGLKTENGWNVEIWDVQKDYNISKPFESDLNIREQYMKFLKGVTPPTELEQYHNEKLDNEKKNISFWRKYANKRYSYTEQEFNDKFEILKKL